MRSRNWLVLFAFLFVFAGCADDDDVCTDCDGGDADAEGGADADADGDTPTTTVRLRVETWTLSPDGTPRDLPGADAEVDGQHCTTPCDLELPVGNHDLFLSMPGWVQGPNPLPINLSESEVVVNEIPTAIVEVSELTVRHRLDKHAEGHYSCSDGMEEDVTTSLAARLGFICPESFTRIGPWPPLGSLCTEGETLTYCKNRVPECEGRYVEGRILEDGRVVEFTFYPGDGGPTEHYSCTRP